MIWLNRLAQSHDLMSSMDSLTFLDQRPVPVAHATQNANLEIQLDSDGDFLAARVLKNPTKKEVDAARKNNQTLLKEQVTMIPVTEASISRTSGLSPHPLHDKLMYVAGDYRLYGGNRSGYEDYMQLLKSWCDFDPGNTVINLVYRYVSKGTMIEDLIDDGLIFQDGGTVIQKWQTELGPKPPLYASVNGNVLDAFVRFTVESDNGNVILPWEDPATINSYISFDESRQESVGFDYVTGQQKTIAKTHPQYVRYAGDRAKLISSNDTQGFTFRGRFVDSKEAAQVSYEISQKAHNALKFLIQRQGHNVGDRVFLISGSSGCPFPDPTADSNAFNEAASDDLGNIKEDTVATYNFALDLANELTAALKGLKHKFDSEKSIFVMILDAPGPGRLSIVYYRDFTGTDKDQFFKNVEAWHKKLSWQQSRFSTNGKGVVHFVGAPSLQEIILAAYGVDRSTDQKGSYLELDSKFSAMVMTQLFPLVIEGSDRLPDTLVRQAFTNACYPQKYSTNNWNKIRTTACSLIKAYRNQKYQENWRYIVDINSSDLTYNIGRLLAVMQQIEERALWISNNEKPRATSAMRYFTKVMEHPSAAFALLASSLVPYRSTLDKAGNAGADLYAMEQQISSLIDPQEFAKIRHLDGRFLLGYDAQLFHIYEENKRRKAEKKIKE
ncbi:MAG: type I-C CRISPR-associated protein Cas8c/Csd1 [Eubacteriales bacterium]|nr:type I-C CRISPR-associated protein Cas8c/Csd1 [Eubacteriales bacterium]